MPTSSARPGTQGDLKSFCAAFKNEAALRDAILTLLRKMGRIEPRETHGPLERGKDIVFYAPSGLEEPALFACVVKNERIIGDIRSGSSAKEVLYQAEQAFEEPHVNASSGHPEHVKGVYIISPYECPPTAIQSIQHRLTRFGRAEFFCGIRLLELFAKHWSSFLLFDSGILIAYLSTLRTQIESNSPMSELIRQTLLSELPASFESLYVNQHFYQELRLPNVDGHLREGLLDGRELDSDGIVKLQARVLTATSLISYLASCAHFQFELPDSQPLSQYFDALSNDWKAAANRQGARGRDRGRHKQGGPKKRVRVPATAPSQRLYGGAMEVYRQTLDLLDAHCTSARKLIAAKTPKLNKGFLQREEYAAYTRLTDIGRSVPGAISFGKRPEHVAVVQDVLTLDIPILMVTGPAGFGKTSFCKRNALRDADRILSHESDILPVYVPLHRLSAIGPDSTSAIFFPSTEIYTTAQDPKATPRLRLYLDGLDEVFDEGRRADIVNLARDFAESRPGIQIVATARDHVSGPFLDGIPRLNVQELDKSQQRELIVKWLQSEQSVQEFFGALKASPSIGELLRIPLLATLIAAVYKKERALPPNRTALYGLFVDLMCGGWDVVKGVNRGSRFGRHDKVLILRLLASDNHSANRREASLADFDHAVTASLSGLAGASRDILGEILQDGLLISTGSGVQFSHLSFQEYLAATDLKEPSGKKATKAVSHFLQGNDWWREVLVFLVSQAANPRDMQRWILRSAAMFSPVRSDNSEAEQRVHHLISALAAAFPKFEPTPYVIKFKRSKVLGEKSRRRIIEQQGARWQRANRNNVKEIRIEFGLFQNDLAKLAKLSVASIRGTESMTRNLSMPLKARIVAALSSLSAKQGRGELKMEAVFPKE
jgi:DNA-binding XRE family transcriptional regulator